MVLFIGAGFVARVCMQSRSSKAIQYAGLGLYVLAWAIMFMPLIVMGNHHSPNLIPQAGIMTAAVFGGLTLSVFVMRKDYSFLAPVLTVGSFIALGLIIAACLFGFSLGLFFCFAMVALLSGYILYDTSAVMLHYPTDMYVAASLELLADVAMMFWYIAQILMSSSRGLQGVPSLKTNASGTTWFCWRCSFASFAWLLQKIRKRACPRARDAALHRTIKRTLGRASSQQAAWRSFSIFAGRSASRATHDCETLRH